MSTSYALVLPLPKNIQYHVTTLCYGLSQTQWLEAFDMHVTLAVLAEAPSDVVTEFVDELEDVICEAVEIALDRVDCRINRRGQGRIWVCVKENSGLQGLIKNLKSLIRELSWPAKVTWEPPHVLLAHVNGCADHQLAGFMAGVTGFTQPPFETSTLKLMEIHSDRHAVHYREYAEFNLTQTSKKKDEWDPRPPWRR